MSGAELLFTVVAVRFAGEVGMVVRDVIGDAPERRSRAINFMEEKRLEFPDDVIEKAKSNCTLRHAIGTNVMNPYKLLEEAATDLGYHVAISDQNEIACFSPEQWNDADKKKFKSLT